MGFNIQKGGNFTICPAGTHVARCYMVIDLGHQPNTYMGKPKPPTRMIRLGFEFPTLLHIFDEARGKEPFTLSRSFTNVLNDRSNLRKVLNEWRGRPLTEEEITGKRDDKGAIIEPPKFTIDKVLGAPALITVTHKPKSDGQMMALLSSIAKLPVEIAGTKINMPPAVLPPILFTVDDGPTEKFKKLPEWLREEISKCSEWQKTPIEPTSQGPAPSDGEQPADSNEPF